MTAEEYRQARQNCIEDRRETQQKAIRGGLLELAAQDWNAVDITRGFALPSQALEAAVQRVSNRKQITLAILDIAQNYKA